MNIQDLEFLCEEEFATIIPSFSMKQLNCINGIYGPFLPACPIKVPLWIGIHLKRLKKCRIQPPYWLDAHYLNQKLTEEKESKQMIELPFHYIELSSLFLKYAEDDIQESQKIRTLLEDLQEIRFQKIREGLRSMNADTQLIQLPNVAAMEIERIPLYSFTRLRQENMELEQVMPNSEDIE